MAPPTPTDTDLLDPDSWKALLADLTRLGGEQSKVAREARRRVVDAETELSRLHTATPESHKDRRYFINAVTAQELIRAEGQQTMATAVAAEDEIQRGITDLRQRRYDAQRAAVTPDDLNRVAAMLNSPQVSQ